MQKSLLIFGAGGYGRVVYELALATGDFDPIAFLDDAKTDAIGTGGDKGSRLHGI